MKNLEVAKIYNQAYQTQGTEGDIMGTRIDQLYNITTKKTLLQALIENLSPTHAHLPLMELGTGDGDLFAVMKEASRQVQENNLYQELLDRRWIGFDISHTGLKNAQAVHPIIEAVAASGCNIPVVDGSVAGIVAADTLEHMPDTEQAFAELYRVLADGAPLVFSVPMPKSLMKWGYNQLLTRGVNKEALTYYYRVAQAIYKRRKIFGKAEFQPIDHDHSIQEWVNMARSAGFRVNQNDMMLWPNKKVGPFPVFPITGFVFARKVISAK